MKAVECQITGCYIYQSSSDPRIESFEIRQLSSTAAPLIPLNASSDWFMASRDRNKSGLNIRQTFKKQILMPVIVELITSSISN